MEQLKKINKKHHSTSDWNFSSTDYSLDTSIYISPPSSLRFSYVWVYALLKQSVAGGPIPEGMIETYARFRYGPAADWYLFIFRNQAADGSANLNNTYMLNLYFTTSGAGQPYNIARFYVVVNGTFTKIEEKSISPAIYPDTWYLLRCKFWVYGGVLMVAFEYFDGSDWVKLCGDFSHSGNRWATSSINRVGIGSAYPSDSPRYSWFDNTRIYRRVS
jgi:hypothetical protein